MGDLPAVIDHERPQDNRRWSRGCQRLAAPGAVRGKMPGCCKTLTVQTFCSVPRHTSTRLRPLSLQRYSALSARLIALFNSSPS